MSGHASEKDNAEQQVSDELAKQPKQDGEDANDSRERRAGAEAKLKDLKTEKASTK